MMPLPWIAEAPCMGLWIRVADPMTLKSPILVFLILALFGCIAHSQTCSDPIRDFLMKNSDSETGEIAPGEPWNGDNDAQPPGGYLFRFEAPIGPNGSPVLFLCLSVLADKRSSAWTAYRRADKSRYALVTGELRMGGSPYFFLLTPKDNGMRGLAQISAGKTAYGVATYHLDRFVHLQMGSLPGMKREQDAEDSDPKAQEAAENKLLQKDKLKTKFIPRIEKVLLAEYLQNPKVNWRPFNLENGITGQHADPSEKRALHATEGFTRKRAAELWKALSRGSSSGN